MIISFPGNGDADANAAIMVMKEEYFVQAEALCVVVVGGGGVVVVVGGGGVDVIDVGAVDLSVIVGIDEEIR